MIGLLRRAVAFIRREPAALGGVFTAAVSLLTALGFNLPAATVAAITSAIAMVVALVVRGQVTPTVTPPAT